MTELRDEFLSEEDLDLRNLSEEELIVYWNLWLRQTQATNDLDEAFYSHGIFERDPAVEGDRVEPSWGVRRKSGKGAHATACRCHTCRCQKSSKRLRLS